MAKDRRAEYEVEIAGQKHVLLLTPEDAEKYDGVTKKDGAADAIAKEAAKSVAASNKALAAGNK